MALQLQVLVYLVLTADRGVNALLCLLSLCSVLLVAAVLRLLSELLCLLSTSVKSWLMLIWTSCVLHATPFLAS